MVRTWPQRIACGLQIRCGCGGSDDLSPPSPRSFRPSFGSRTVVVDQPAPAKLPTLLEHAYIVNRATLWVQVSGLRGYDPSDGTMLTVPTSQNGPVYAAATTSQSTLGDFVVQSFSLEDISRGDSEVGLPTPGTTQHRGPAQGLLSTEPLPGRPSRTPGSRRGDRSATPYSRSTRGQKPRTSAVTSSQISTPGDQSPMPPGPNTRQAFDPAEGFHPSTGYAEETSGADVEQPITGPVANGISRQPSSSAGSHVCHGYGCSKTFLTPSGLQYVRRWR